MIGAVGLSQSGWETGLASTKVKSCDVPDKVDVCKMSNGIACYRAYYHEVHTIILHC